MITPDMTCVPVGFVSSPFKQHGDAPRQGRLTNELSTIHIRPEYAAAAENLQPGDDLFVFCWFDRADRTVVKSGRFGDETKPPAGVFSSRSPNRPNPIALTLVKLICIEGTDLIVRGLEAFDGTPVIDIKTYSPGIDMPQIDGKKLP